MTLMPARTVLVPWDGQERRFPAMDTDHREEVMGNIKALAASARRLRVPILVTDQADTDPFRELARLIR